MLLLKNNCKPVSRILYSDVSKRASVIYLDQQSPADSICLPSGLSEQLYGFRRIRAGIHGISTHKVYPLQMLPFTTVRSYRTFSPLPQTSSGRLFSATLAVFLPKKEPHPLGGVLLCVVRTFLMTLKAPRQSGLQLLPQSYINNMKESNKVLNIIVFAKNNFSFVAWQ